MKVLSCVPKQLNTYDDKLNWLKDQFLKSVDIIVTPQEFFGGAVMMSHQRSFSRKNLFPVLSELCKKHDTALVVGVQEFFEEDSTEKEAIWFIDRDGSFKGSIYKFALPSYDHVCTNGFGNIIPETNFANRFQIFEICGLRVTGLFCWEAFSNVLWTGLALCQPDLVFSLTKFGVSAWPKNEKVNGKTTVVDFGYAGWNNDSDVWIDRLRFANLFQVNCPIVNSTNSWNLRPSSKPLCGTISLLPSQAENTLWFPKKADKLKEIPEKIIIDEFDPNKLRYGRENKFMYKEAVGEWPPYSIGEYTMLLKMNRIENRIRLGSEQKKVDKKITKQRGFDL